jgi:membrane-associated PAP2 superfamily phosphatase
MNPAFLIHAILMMAAWLVLLPAGARVARFCKVTPGQNWPQSLDNLLWWRLHRLLQYAGVACALIGVGVAYWATGQLPLALAHVQIGLIVILLAILQILSTWFRGSKGGPTGEGADPHRPETWRGDHYDMTLRRRLFEGWHKTCGWWAIILAPLAVLLGLALLDWPFLLCCLATLLVIVAVTLATLLARGARGINTYEAIWGPDRRHPGNRPLGEP